MISTVNSFFKLYNGDCIELLGNIPDGAVNLVLIDPPYNIAKENNFKTMGRSGIDFGEWDKGFDLYSYIDLLKRVCHKDANLFIFNDWKNIGEIAKYAEKQGFVIKDLFRWEKSNPMPRNRDRRFIVDFEVGVWLTMPNSKWCFNRQSDTYDRPKFVCSTVSNRDRVHPTQKPVKLLEHLINTLSNKGDTVLDCFMGSGSTGVSSLKNGRNFIGIELDKVFFDNAKKSIELEVQVK